jgi:hypothetical protein
VGLSPAITVVEHSDGLRALEARSRFLDFARSLGLVRPRLKFLPLLRIGREETRTRGYASDELAPLRSGPLGPEIVERLVCSTSRLVTARGVLTCPVLLDAPGAHLANTLAESLRPIRLRWAACRTCVAEGLSCNT